MPASKFKPVIKDIPYEGGDVLGSYVRPSRLGNAFKAGRVLKTDETTTEACESFHDTKLVGRCKDRCAKAENCPIWRRTRA